MTQKRAKKQNLSKQQNTCKDRRVVVSLKEQILSTDISKQNFPQIKGSYSKIPAKTGFLLKKFPQIQLALQSHPKGKQIIRSRTRYRINYRSKPIEIYRFKKSS